MVRGRREERKDETRGRECSMPPGYVCVEGEDRIGEGRRGEEWEARQRRKRSPLYAVRC